MRRARVKFTLESLESILNLSGGITIENIDVDIDRRTVTIVVASSDDSRLYQVAEGQMIPETCLMVLRD